MSATKSQPLTKEEVMYLINVIENTPIITSKATNAASNQLKEAAWKKITETFNSVSSRPRRPEQLRLKWENLKKTARKRNTKIRTNNLQTGGGKPDYIPPDEALEKVAAILGPTCDGYTVPFGGDAEMVVVDEGCDIELNLEGSSIPSHGLVGDGLVEAVASGGGIPPVIEICDESATTTTTASLPKPPKSQSDVKKFFFNSTNSKGKQKTQKLSNEDTEWRINRNKAIAEYFISKKQRLELTNEKIKLETELLKLQLKGKLDKDSESNV